MRLVLTYNVSDGYTYAYEVVTPIVYESAEAFYCHFEEALQLHVEKLSSYHKTYDNWYAKILPIRRQIRTDKKDKNKDKWLDRHAEMMKEMPTRPDSKFRIGNYEFEYEYFVVNVNGKVEISMPDICTVDEWFNHVD